MVSSHAGGAGAQSKRRGWSRAGPHEDGDEVDKEVERSADVVLLALVRLLNDDLRQAEHIMSCHVADRKPLAGASRCVSNHKGLSLNHAHQLHTDTSGCAAFVGQRHPVPLKTTLLHAVPACHSPTNRLH